MTRESARKKRHQRIRNKITGTPGKPRMSVSRSLNNIYVQIIDDLAGNTVAAASSEEPAIKEKISHGGNKEAASLVGELAAERALEKGIEEVVFDRSGYKYHGRVAKVAEAAREKGLKL
ncbi:MAG: 50S ribosomal protein L18 [Halanaerobiaceae bacterium]